MTDPCGRSPMPMAPMPMAPMPMVPTSVALLGMADDVARAQGRFHPGRPAFSALSRACDALRAAAREVDHARRTYAPGPDGSGA
jgi:hypothetical protein